MVLSRENFPRPVISFHIKLYFFWITLVSIDVLFVKLVPKYFSSLVHLLCSFVCSNFINISCLSDLF